MAYKGRERPPKAPVVIVALPFAYREGSDEYNGVMRFLRETGEMWDLRIVRHSFGVELFRDFSANEIDGVICGINTRPSIIGYEQYFDEAVLDLLTAANVPVVGIDLPVNPQCMARKKVALISVDSENIGRMAAQCLAKAGPYASFGFVGAFSNLTWSRDRGAFFARELRRLGKRNVSIFQGDSRRQDGELIPWLKTLRKPAAVFASNDHCADIVLKACQKGDIRVPDDMSVLGVDDDPIFCVHTNPSLSSMHPDFEAEGYLAAQTLATFLKGRKPRTRMVVAGTVTVTARMSTAPCSTAGRLVRRADELIAERACLGLNADVLAGMLGVSRRLLDLRYRQITDRSVRAAIESVRLARAKELLAGSTLSHKMIAKSCGYASESYLEHVFAKQFGMSMRNFRASGDARHESKP